MNQKIEQETKDIELIIGKILRVGVFVAAAVIVAGLAMFLVEGTGGYPANAHPSRPAAIIQGAIALKPYAVLMVGLFLLILTPVLRVVVSIYAFFKEQDWLYTWITTAVLVILIGAMVIGYLG